MARPATRRDSCRRDVLAASVSGVAPRRCGSSEQAQPLLEREHPAHGGIDLALRDPAAPQRDGEPSPVGVGHHVDVYSGLQRKRRRLREVSRDAVMDEFGDGVVIAHDHTLETELFAEPTPQQSRMRGHRNSRKIGEGRHDRRDPRRHRGGEGR